MSYADIHIHALFGVDDGARTEADMFRIVDAAYMDGARMLCLTPHFHPGYFGDNRKKTAEAFKILRQYAGENHSDLELYLGNELRYSKGCLSWLDDGACRTLGESNHVLVDFSQGEGMKTIIGGLERLLNGGYVPILAHVERYTALRGKKQILRELHGNGVLLQVDSQSVFGGFGLGTCRWARGILNEKMADIVASDAHDLRSRPPGLDRSFRYIEKKCGAEYAAAVCRGTPRRLLEKNNVRKEVDPFHG